MKILDCPFPELLDEPQVEPEYVWTTGLYYEATDKPYISALDSRETAEAVRARHLISGDYAAVWSQVVVSVQTGEFLSDARRLGKQYARLLDSDLNELRRWDLRGHRGEGS